MFHPALLFDGMPIAVHRVSEQSRYEQTLDNTMLISDNMIHEE